MIKSTTEAGNSVASVKDSAVQAMRDGAADARAAVDRAIPAVSNFVSRFVYTTSYSLSYGVVFPTMFVARMIPRDNPFVHGMIDGARAATDLVDDWQARRSASAGETGALPA